MTPDAMPHEALQQLVAQTQRHRACGDVLLAVRSPRHGVAFRSQAAARPFFIASATKLYVSALMAQLREAGAVDWRAPMATYLPDLDLRRLAIYRGVDVTAEITIEHLLAHTSGLPDYFEARRADGTTTIGRAMEADFAWSLQDVIGWTRDMGHAHGRPGAMRRGVYSDTNYQLLGAIIERQFRASFADAVEQQICRPLGLRDTYCFTPATLTRYGDVCAMKRGQRPLAIPQAMASVGADGGIVSTLHDAMTFLVAFTRGELFAPTIYEEMQQTWRRIFFPLQYGTGIMRFEVPWFFSPFRRTPALVGHSGASGTVMFYCQAWDTYVVATVNQVEQRSLPYQLMIKALHAAVPRT